jgi:hypothetical protein
MHEMANLSDDRQKRSGSRDVIAKIYVKLVAECIHFAAFRLLRSSKQTLSRYKTEIDAIGDEPSSQILEGSSRHTAECKFW